MFSHKLRYVSLSIFQLAHFIFTANADIDPIVIKGSHFFYQTNGSQFFIRGVYYHERPKFASTRSSAISTSDLLADPAVCKRDIPDLVRLGINTLFLNGVNAELNHAECMQSLQDAGIYVLVQLNPIYVNVYTGNGMPVADWGYLSEKANSRLIDGFQKFSNTLGFVWKSRAPPASEIGRELAFGRTDVGSLKEYIRKMNYRRIPIGSIGYCHRKSSVIDFFTCGSQTNSIDFYGMNHALDPPGECEVVSPPIYDGSVETYRNSSIPLFVFYGDLAKTQPDFPEVTDIYANSTSEVFSGGILLSWYEADDHDQGLVEVHQGNIVTRPRYSALSSRLASIQPSSTVMDHYTPTNTAPSICSSLVIRDYIDPTTNLSSTVEIAPAFPAVPYQRLCSCMMERLSCVVPTGVDMSTDKMRAVVDSICLKDPLFCQAVQGNSTTGVYGAFLGCSLAEAGSWIFNQVVEAHSNNPAICKSLTGTTQTPTPSPSQDSDCRVLLEQVGPNGMGIVTFTPEAKSTVKINEIKHGSKISTPAAVGIGVGIFIGLILVSILILAIRTRRRLRSGAKKHDSQEFGKPELEDNSNTIQTKGIANIDSLGRSKQFAQGDGLQRTELEADGAVEIDTQGERVEIGGEREMHEIGTDREMYELPAGNEKAELPAGDGKAELPAGNEEAELDGCGGLKPL